MATGTAIERGLRDRPSRPQPVLPNSVFGTLLFVFTEIMLFAGMVSAHVIFRSQQVGEMWPPAGQPLLPMQQTAINTMALLASGVVLVFARIGFGREPRRAVFPMAIAVLLGGFFVVAQGVEWVALIGEGLTLTSSNYGGFFYLIVGTHALHAAAAIGFLIWGWFRLKRGLLTTAHFDSVQIFWLFVVLVWPVLYYQVYLR